MNQDDVALLERVTRPAPLQFLRQLAVESDRSERRLFFLPRLGFFEVSVELGFRFVHGLML
jgi:hypothetical protein